MKSISLKTCPSHVQMHRAMSQRTTNRTSLTETTGSADGASINKVRPRLTHPSILPKRVLSLFSRSAMVNGHAL